MTKQEVRAVALSKARLFPGALVWDIGAGTGSISIEAGFLVGQEGRVYAVEKDPVAVSVLRHNVKRFGVENVIILEGEAPGVLDGLEGADRIIVGGTGGRLPEILERANRHLRPGGLVVVLAVTVDTFVDGVAVLEALGYEAEMVSVTVARAETFGVHRLWRGQNPVTIITGQKPGRE